MRRPMQQDDRALGIINLCATKALPKLLLQYRGNAVPTKAQQGRERYPEGMAQVLLAFTTIF